MVGLIIMRHIIINPIGLIIMRHIIINPIGLIVRGLYSILGRIRNSIGYIIPPTIVAFRCLNMWLYEIMGPSHV